MSARSPGPIAAPEPLLTLLGEYRQLHLALADPEPGHAWLGMLEQPTELELDLVLRQEAALDATFSDALLAVLACRVPHLEDSLEMQLAGLDGLDAEARALGCPPELLPVARQGDLFHCVPRREHPWATTTVTPWHSQDGAGLPRGLVPWLKAVALADLHDLLHELGCLNLEEDDPLPPQARADVAQVPAPRLVDHRGVLAVQALRVEHAKFGVGRVLRATGEGDARKLEIDFGAAGVRTILARFVRELPPAS